jgi:gliding motility-associated-like protein
VLSFLSEDPALQPNWQSITTVPTITNFKVEIFNRWGQLVYKDINGAIVTSGWDGMSNQGLRLGGEGVPDGTYFYVLKLSNEKEQRVSYMTLAR